ncbi:hypothetical protein F4679DRAFT_600335 [Xylaria curta]|nr:hypothetical protein F4679DRAFT_600335 [Xylaria curta]
MSSSTGQLTAHVNNDESKLLCDELNRMTMQEPASLATAPAEILINILGYLRVKKDWLCLARSCRRVSNFVVAELDKYAVGDGDYYAVWYACVANKPTILLRHIAFDATIVNRHFTKDFRRKARRIRRNTKYGTQCRFDPERRVFGKGMTPLSVAIIAGNKAIVQLLLANGADPNRRDLASARMPWWPIHWAVVSEYESSVAIIKMLGAHSVNTNTPHKDPTDRHIYRAPIFKLLELQKPRWDNIDERETNCEEFNNDLWQLQGLRLRQLEALLLQCRANPNIVNDPTTREWKMPVFHLLEALENYRPSFYFHDSLKLSHEVDTQVDVVNDIVMLFLDKLRDFGAHIRAIGYFGWRYQTPLHAACRLNDGHKPIIDWFLRNGVSINSLDSSGCTPLIAYCDSGFKDLGLFRKFLSNGPLINHSDFDGRTALHYLCANRDLTPQVMEKAVKIMLDRGADPTFISNQGLVPAQELDPKGFEDPSKSHHKDQEDTKSRNSKNNGRLALTRSEARVGRPDHRPSDREHQAGRGKDRRENHKDGRVDEKTGHGTAGPVSSRSHNHAIPEGSNRGNRREDRREDRRENQRENRGSHQNSNRGSTQHINGNDDKGKGKDKQDTSRKRCDEDITPQGNDQSTPPPYIVPQKLRGGTQHRNGDNNNGKGKESQDTRHNKDNAPQGNDQSPPPQYTFQQKVRGGKYCGAANQGGHESSRDRPRDTKPKVIEKSIKSEPAAKQTSLASQSWFRQRGYE